MVVPMSKSLFNLRGPRGGGRREQHDRQGSNSSQISTGDLGKSFEEVLASHWEGAGNSGTISSRRRCIRILRFDDKVQYIGEEEDILQSSQREERCASSSSPSSSLLFSSSCVEDHWYSVSDFPRFQQAQSLLAKGVSRSMPHYMKGLKSAYLTCNRLAQQPYTYIMEDDRILSLNPQDRENFAHALTVDCVGLESQCLSETIKSEERRQKLRKIVVQQQRHKYQHDPERLRRACEALSRSSALFARELALARLRIP